MKKIIITTLLVASFRMLIFAQDVNHSKQSNLENGLAIQGYDPVAYFTVGKAVKGSKENAVTYNGALYYFATAESKETFKKSPVKFEPAYGGWCAYAMGAKGEKVSVDPKTFKIVDGHLNLFYNKYFNNTLEDWNKDETNLKKKADLNWAKLATK